MKLVYGSVYIFILLISGCGGSGGGGGSTNPPPLPVVDIEEGNLSGGMEGMNYSSGDTTGTMDANGLFRYEVIDGVIQTVTFSIGNIDIATVTGNTLITLLDFVASGSADSVELQNIAAFLLLLDEDQDSTNGLNLSDALLAFLENNNWMEIDFTDSDFANQTSIVNVIADLASVENDGRTLPNTATALTHLQLDFWCSASGLYAGTFTGDDSGPFVMGIDSANGNVGAFGYSEDDQSVFVVPFDTGSPLAVNNDSNFIAGNLANSEASFTGSLESFQTVSGDWENPEFSIDGAFSGTRVATVDDDLLRYTVIFFNGALGGNLIVPPANYGLIQINVDANNNVDALMVDAGGVETPLTGTITPNANPMNAAALSLTSQDSSITLNGDIALTAEQNLAGDFPGFGGFWTNSTIGVENSNALAIAFGSGCHPQ